MLKLQFAIEFGSMSRVQSANEVYPVPEYLYILSHAVVTQHVSHVLVVDLKSRKVKSALEGSAVEITVQIPANCYSIDDLLCRSDSTIQQTIRQQLNLHRLYSFSLRDSLSLTIDN